MIHTARRLRRLAVALAAAAALSLLTTGVVDLASTARPAHADAGPVVDDYPYRGQSSGVDPWNFYKGQCTSFAAWRLNDRIGIDFTNQYLGEHFGNANTWDDAARRAGLTVSSTPRPGAIAQSDAGSFGHVAWVARVNGDGTVLIEEYNWARPSGYGTRTVSASSFEYIYFGNPPAVNLAAESVNGDRYEDLLAVDSGNVLWSYPGRSGLDRRRRRHLRHTRPNRPRLVHLPPRQLLSAEYRSAVPACPMWTRWHHPLTSRYRSRPRRHGRATASGRGSVGSARRRTTPTGPPPAA
ncbi:CHAP domain-containing protein [Phytohabitans sp. LJ34]|uniref:CHAP domain-containing protein n=1 Tax=Phytohabitans sp. LJ34 TaxID=3452217 RepID=UPI003F8BC24C